MVVNFMSLKGFSFCPTLSWMKNMSLPVSFTRIEIMISTGERIMMASKENRTSTIRFSVLLWFSPKRFWDVAADGTLTP
jgi:hypothetical protein